MMTAIPEPIERVIRAAMLDVEFYNEAEADTSLNGAAAIVVVLASALGGVGAAFATEVNIIAGAFAGAITGLIGWLVWSAIALFIGSRLGGTSDFGEMVRVIGFSYAPLAIGVVPWLGFVGAIWALVAAVIAIREGMDFSTSKAIATMAVGWGAWLVLTLVVQAVLDIEINGGWPL